MWLVWVCVFAGLAACSETPEAESPEALTADLGEPLDMLGADADGDLLFSGVTRMVPGPDGQIAVVESTFPRVLVFDSAGTLVDSIAAEGRGPGEFVEPRDAGFLGDTLWVADRALARVSFFHNGEFLGSGSLPRFTDLHPDRGAVVVGLLDGRRMLVHTIAVSGMDPLQVASEPGFLFVADSTELEPILRLNVDFVGGMLAHRVGGEIRRVSPFPQPFSEAAKVGIDPVGSRIVVGSVQPRGYEILTLSPNGDTVSVVRRMTPGIEIPNAVADSIVRARVQGPYSEAVVRDALYVPSRYPAVSGLIPAYDGSVWVARERVFGVPPAWDVHRSDGSVLSVQPPEGFDVRVPLGTSVWGLEHDAFDVPRLVRRPLIRTESNLGTGEAPSN